MLFSVFAIKAQSPEELIAGGNKAYSLGQYEAAISLYNKVLEKGFDSPSLYYNLGNAFFKNNQIPSAILSFEKSLKLDPNNADTRYNLAVANSRITDKIEKVPELFYKRWWSSVKNIFALDSLAVLMIILAATGLILAGLYLAARRTLIRRIAFWSSSSLLILACIITGLALDKSKQIRQKNEGILFTPTVTVKSSPDPSSIDLFVIHEGTKVNIQDSIGSWIEVKIANGSQGWIQSTDIRKI